MPSEAKACPTCSSEFRDIPSPAYCRDKWHDAPPQPASTGVCSRHQHGEDPTCQICFPVQPAPAGFEEALRLRHYAHSTFYNNCAACGLLLAEHAKEVEEARRRGYKKGCTDVADTK